MSDRIKQSGILYVVATPIGNLGDLSTRAREVLDLVTVVAAEDTRHTGQLLRHLGVATPLLSLHEHNEARRTQELLARLDRGEDVALVSDAGTPLISDPGFDVVRAAVAHGARVVPIPGACAAITALSIAGLPTDRFAFEGFLPAKNSARRERLQGLRNVEHTLVFYEAPHRLADTLAALGEVFGGDRRAVVARELTKQFETLYRGSLSELAECASNDPDMTRGEIVIVVAGESVPASVTALDAETVLRVLLEELSPAQSAKLTAKLTGAKRADLYDKALAYNKRDSL